MNHKSWGRFPKTESDSQRIPWISDYQFPTTNTTLLSFGQGRSYGDVCLNDKGLLLETQNLDHFISFDEAHGVLRCEAGVTLAQILKLIVPKGWFLPVSPGTKFISVGGAIANDIHGKNHHRHGTFGCHVLAFELLRSDGSRTVCTPESNTELFKATIGGLGLTGLITWTSFKLRKIQNPWMDVEHIKFSKLSEFFELSAASDKDYEYTVSWVDLASKNKKFGRGIFMRGNHCIDATPLCENTVIEPKFNVFFDASDWMLNNFNMKAFAFAFYNKQLQKAETKRTHYDPFFYPLDAVGSWNRLYGKRGFFQYQCVIPKNQQEFAMTEIFEKIKKSDVSSFLTVLKIFGSVTSPGMLSFPKEGATLCVDIPHKGASTLRLFDSLDETVLRAGGGIYPAKDARMSKALFEQTCPLWKDFQKYMDPNFSSSFWRRVTA